MDEKRINSQRQYDTAVISVNPAVTAKGILHVAKSGAKALILLAYASGTTPRWINPAIREVTEMGIPVFLLANSPGDKAGILNDTKYEPQAESKEAGALALQKVNINHLVEVLDAIQDEVDAGKSGKELGRSIHAKFAYQAGEEIPKAEWDTPEGIAALQERQRMQMNRQLKGMN